MNARLYDPILGRFLSPDPFVQAPGDLENFNRYSYAMNNPLMYVDESGEFIFTLLASLFPPLIPVGIVLDGACLGAAVGAAGYVASVALSEGGFKNWNPNDLWKSIGIGATSGAIFAGMGLIAPTFAVSSTSFMSNLPTYLGKAGWAALSGTTAAGGGMLVGDWIDDGKINASNGNYLEGMGIAGLTAGLLSFGSSVYDYATWDRLSTDDKMTKIQTKFGSNVKYDPTSTNYGYYNPGNADVFLGPAALESKGLAFSTARHELKHLSDWNKYTAGNLTIPAKRGNGFIGVRNHLEIRAHKLEMRYFRNNIKFYLNRTGFLKYYGYKGLFFEPNPFMYFNSIF